MIMGVTAILVASVQLAVAGPAVVQPPVRCLQLEPLAASGTAERACTGVPRSSAW